MSKKLSRCWSTDNPLYIRYHDEEWGVPVHDDRVLFEFLVLEGFQAGLTWELVLKRREALRKAFDGFNPKKIARYTDEDFTRLINNPDIIRNRAKISAVINNAHRYKEVRKEYDSFDAFVWQFVNGGPIDHELKSFASLPSESDESRAMSAELKRRGFKFVGPTICYAFMQAVGLVNDHLIHCFRYGEIQKIGQKTGQNASRRV
ncbi:DNA-3-methyladenine glycosylase I [Candidatus Bathyarchaeota archaeon]|nr:DNA-3-methyladenine glycosylase I [Candidatus Bathyarchaeota archaeon]